LVRWWLEVLQLWLQVLWWGLKELWWWLQVCRYAVPTAGALTSTFLLTVCRVSSKLGLYSSTLHGSSTLLCFY
jgi:hypothetical protein